jgi:hypothetical protein
MEVKISSRLDVNPTILRVSFSVKPFSALGARTICQEGHSGAVPLLKAPFTRAGRGGAEGGPSANPFFSLFPAL